MGSKQQGTSFHKGRQGEASVLSYLKKCGWCILAQNYRTTQGEVDFIAMDGDDLVFIEVKSGIADLEDLAQRVDQKKRDRIEQMAKIFQHKHHLEQHPIRFDVIIVSLPQNNIQHFSHEFFDH